MEAPHAIILGSGTSNGVPSLGRIYPPEFLANPKNHRTRASLLLRSSRGDFLIDCSPEMRLQLLRENVTMIEGVLITHTHADHVMGMDDLRSFCLHRGAPMPVFAQPAHQEDIRRIFSYAFREYPPGVWVPRFELQDVPPVLETIGLRLRTFVVPHGPHRVIAFRVNDFAYLTDCSGIPDEVRPLLEGLDVLVLDAVRRAPHPNHLHTEAALRVASEIGARTTYFTHLSDDYDHDEDEARLPDGVLLAHDGLKIPLK